jgi:DNA ligase (NAD+)
MLDINELENNPIKYANSITVNELVETLEMLSNAYYNTDEPIVSDEIYDKLFEILKKRDPKNKYLKNIGAPIKGTKELVKLPFEMGSLTKIKPGDKELSKWIKKFKGPYHLSDKLDGVSAQIYKKQSGEICMYSRGNGKEGQNISHLLKYVVSSETLKKIPLGSSIRGELIISIINFKKIKKQMKNARNAVAGLVNAKNFNENIAKITEFVAYAILNPSNYYREQIKLLESYKFNVVVNKPIKDEITEDFLKEYFEDRKKNSAYDIDGMVCVDDSKIYPSTGGYPAHSFAFKMITKDQIAITKIIKVLWKPSKDGYLKPKIKIKPVELVGVTVEYATAYNAKFIVDNNIGPGAKIKIIRSGDVIPKIMEVITGAKNGPQMPEFPHQWNKTKVDLILKDNNDSDYDSDNSDANNGQQMVIIGLLIHFFLKIGVKFLSKGLIEKFVENGYDSVIKILKADKKKLYKISGLGEKSIDKIYEEIDRAFNEMTLEQFMGASNELGRLLGSIKLKLVVAAYPNLIEEFQNYDKEEIAEKIIKIEGFSNKLSNQFAENFQNFIEFYNEIAKVKDLSRFNNIKIKKANGPFNGKSFVFTGFRDENMAKFITDNGGEIKTSVSGNTYMLIHKDDANVSNNKFIKAGEKGILITKKSDFIKKFMM